MRYPVGRPGNTLDNLWYIAQDFGAVTIYGYHEGWDVNVRTGGDSDLGQPLYAVADGVIRYYHNTSHPDINFGRHMVLECSTPRGTRWYHYAHAQEITTGQQTVQEGDVIGKLGKSGTSSAHLHFSVYKVNPSGLLQGIDSIAKTKTQLNNSWEKFEILEEATMPTELQIYLGVQNDTEAKARLKEHLGEFNGKCDFGNAEGDRGGFLGSSRRRVKELESQPVPTPVDPYIPPVVPGRTENGLNIHVPQPDGTIFVWNYKR